jgi:hypothetical protein
MDFQIGNSWEASQTGNRRRDSRNRSFEAGSGQVDSQTGNKHSELQIGQGKRDAQVGENRVEDPTGDVQMHFRSGEYSDQYRTNMSPSSSRNPDNRRGSLMETNNQNFEHEKKTRWETQKDLKPGEEQGGRLTWMQKYEEPVQREHSMKTHLITDYLLKSDKKVPSKGSNSEADGLGDIPNLTWGRRAEAGPAERVSTRSEDTVNTLRHIQGKRPRSSAGGQEGFTRLPHRMENDLTSSFSSGAMIFNLSYKAISFKDTKIVFLQLDYLPFQPTATSSRY